jgi:peptide deformylase
MARRKIVLLGTPVLRQVAREVAARKLRSKALQRLIDDLLETQHAADGAGLAAPQVGSGLRVFVSGGFGRIAQRVLINPVATPLPGEKISDWEGCLSIPGLRGLVPRHARIRLRARGRDGEPLDFIARGFEARILQHELDHLDGVVFLDRLADLGSLVCDEEVGTAE